MRAYFPISNSCFSDELLAEFGLRLVIHIQSLVRAKSSSWGKWGLRVVMILVKYLTAAVIQLPGNYIGQSRRAFISFRLKRTEVVHTIALF
jgi:hypothetical protein